MPLFAYFADPTLYFLFYNFVLQSSTTIIEKALSSEMPLTSVYTEAPLQRVSGFTTQGGLATKHFLGLSGAEQEWGCTSLFETNGSTLDFGM